MKLLAWMPLMLLVLTLLSCTTLGTAMPPKAVLTTSPLVPTAPSTPTATEPPTVTPSRAATLTSAPTSQPAATLTTTPSLSRADATPILSPTYPPTVLTQIAIGYATLHAERWPTPVGTPDPYNLIDDALARGEIDIDHASVFRLYALFGSPFLPSRLQGSGLIHGDGLGAWVYAMKDYDLTSPATQKFLGDFMTPHVITQTVPTPTFPAMLPINPPIPGVYVTVLTPQDNLAGGHPLAGRWKLDLTGSERALLYLNDKLVITREYTFSGDQIRLDDLFGSYACEDDGQVVTYTWAIQNQRLEFKNINDNCGARVRVMEAHPWNKP